mmetsp:Transcript_25001/g.50174  ORF Transcript_25001/g.50174 Transcript_25001/m.50174 type:complete len:334 (+) Transcript_25001:32-1033(+)
MREVIITSIDSSWSKTYSLDSLSFVPIRNLKELCMVTNPTLFTNGQINFVLNGSLISSDDAPLGDFVEEGMEPVQIFIFVTDKTSVHPRIFDPASITAAKHSFESNNGRSARHGMESINLLDWEALSCVLAAPCCPGGNTNSLHLPARAQEAAPLPPAVAAAAEVPVRDAALPVVRWFQWGVMARLLVVAFLFTYNRHLSRERLINMAFMTVFSYLFQIGALAYGIAWIALRLGLNIAPAQPVRPPHPNPNPAPGVAQEQEAGGGAGVAVAAGDGGVPAGAPGGRLGLLQSIVSLYQSGFTIPTTPGMLMDLISLLMGIFLSIVPGWTPYRVR